MLQDNKNRIPLVRVPKKGKFAATCAGPSFSWSFGVSMNLPLGFGHQQMVCFTPWAAKISEGKGMKDWKKVGQIRGKGPVALIFSTLDQTTRKPGFC